MKKILSIIFLVLIFSGYAQANWKGFIKKDEFDGKTRKLLSGSFIKPGIPLGYPFEELSMFPQLNCTNRKVPLVGFFFYDADFNHTEVHLVDGKYLNDKTSEFNFRIKHGEQLENIKVEQDFAYKDSLFVSLADNSRVFNWFKNEETIVLELKHYGDGVRYYKIDTKGFKKVYNDTCL
jgi:hypothetical protein|tara:strand:+ start:375 stop:908 length:534 start_codon:yes stop_codon:yes gene_type:complete